MATVHSVFGGRGIVKSWACHGTHGGVRSDALVNLKYGFTKPKFVICFSLLINNVQ